MAQKPLEEQNWYARFVESYGPTFRIDINNPQMGYGGEDVYTLYGVTKKNDRSSISFDQSGKLKINSDLTLEIVAGEKNSSKGEDILIHSRNGSISITADKNGNIKISGQNVTVESDYDMDFIAGSDINFNGANFNVNANGLFVQGLTGNLLPPEMQFTALVFTGSRVGGEAINNVLKNVVVDALELVPLPGGVTLLSATGIPDFIKNILKGVGVPIK